MNAYLVASAPLSPVTAARVQAAVIRAVASLSTSGESVGLRGQGLTVVADGLVALDLAGSVADTTSRRLDAATIGDGLFSTLLEGTFGFGGHLGAGLVDAVGTGRDQGWAAFLDALGGVPDDALDTTLGDIGSGWNHLLLDRPNLTNGVVDGIPAVASVMRGRPVSTRRPRRSRPGRHLVVDPAGPRHQGVVPDRGWQPCPPSPPQRGPGRGLARRHRPGDRLPRRRRRSGHAGRRALPGRHRRANYAVHAGDRGHNVTHVVTGGSPIATVPVPDHVSVLAIEHYNDLVPRLDGSPNPDRTNVTTVMRDVGGSDAHGASPSLDLGDAFGTTTSLFDRASSNPSSVPATADRPSAPSGAGPRSRCMTVARRHRDVGGTGCGALGSARRRASIDSSDDPSIAAFIDGAEPSRGSAEPARPGSCLPRRFGVLVTQGHHRVHRSRAGAAPRVVIPRSLESSTVVPRC